MHCLAASPYLDLQRNTGTRLFPRQGIRGPKTIFFVGRFDMEKTEAGKRASRAN